MKAARCRSREGCQRRGFKNPHRVSYTVFNLAMAQVDHLVRKNAGSPKGFLTGEPLHEWADQSDRPWVKLLGNGELKSKIGFKVNAVSEKAKSGC